LWRQNPFQRRVPLAGGAPGSGAPRANRNARKHGLSTRDAIAERREIRAQLGEARKLLEEIKWVASQRLVAVAIYESCKTIFLDR
jgi:hypothetical protein